MISILHFLKAAAGGKTDGFWRTVSSVLHARGGPSCLKALIWLPMRDFGCSPRALPKLRSQLLRLILSGFVRCEKKRNMI